MKQEHEHNDINTLVSTNGTRTTVRKPREIALSGVKRVIASDFTVEPDEEWLPVAAFLDKPVRPDQLLKEIERLLSDRSHS